MKNEQGQRRDATPWKGAGGRRTGEAEFHEFVVARWPRLVRTAYLLTGDRHHPEDLAQATLVWAFQGWSRVRVSDSPDAYVHPTGILKGPEAVDDVYVTGPNGLRDRVPVGGGINAGRLDFLLSHFRSPGADVAAGAGVATLGTGSMDNSSNNSNKEKASPCGIDFASGIVSSKVARVQVVFGDGTSQDAKLVASPAGEDGQYFYLPFRSTSWHPDVSFVFYDGQGHILPSRDS